MSDRTQAIKDVADALAYTAKLGDDDALSCSMGYAALQRERVLQLERALRDARQSIVDGKPLRVVNLIDAAMNGESK